MANLLLFDMHKEVEPLLPDAAERACALDTHRSWIVEAPAGSGKTGILIQRYLKLLADGSVSSPEQVLAITFTRKATAEMRERVLAQLQAADRNDEPGNDFDRATRPLAMAALVRDRALGWQLLDQPGRLRIRTIDSVCSEIANSLPVLSGTGGRRDVVDDAGELYALAAHRTFLQLGGGEAALNNALREVLLHRDGDLANCERLLASMLSLRDQWGALVPLGRRELDDAYLDAEVLTRLERALENAICSVLSEIKRLFPEHLLHELTLAAASMAHLSGSKGGRSLIAICANRTLAPAERAQDLEHWRALIHLLLTKDRDWRKSTNAYNLQFALSKAEAENLKALIAELQQHDDLLDVLRRVAELPPAKYPPEQWAMAKALFRVLNHAMVELQLVFAERGTCDYAEIALAAKTALRAEDGAHDLEAALGLRLQHILVDEMQDTSSSQYELIEMLTAHFDGQSQTVFLVGDPKQSIYLFRQARVERFLHAMYSGQLGDVRLGLLRLTANFRSEAGLVENFNADFSRIFSASAGDGEVHFVAASAMRREAAESGHRVWHAAVLPYTKRGEISSESREHPEATAKEMRAIIEDWRARPLPPDRQKPWQIAVLVRSRAHLGRLVTALKDSSQGPPITYRAVDIDPLKERPEVQDLFALTRALLHPADRPAWLAVLRAPWCGFGLAELHTLTGADDPAFVDWTIRALIAEHGDRLPVEAIRRLERIWPILEAALAARHRASLAKTVERTWRSLGGDAYLDAAGLANAHTYLRLLHDLDQQKDGVSVRALEGRLNRLFAAPSLDPSAVELLTIHKAKGLEWDVVIVPALEKVSGQNRSQLLSWAEVDPGSSGSDRAAQFVLAPIAGKGEATAQLYQWIGAMRKSREFAEDKRLFYVACTRAREELHLFASPMLSSKRELQPASGTLLKAAWPAAEAVFDGPLASAPTPANVAAFPSTTSNEGLDLAASAFGQERSAPEQPTFVQRLPLSFEASSRLVNANPLSYGDADEIPSPQFERPEGSVAARAFGNCVHAFLEHLTQQIAAGAVPAALTAALREWKPRIAAVLRSEGLPPAMVERLTERVLQTLSVTLEDRTGQWLLSAHRGSATEFALTTWAAQRGNIRIDRVFRAGPEPLAPDADYLWIVDYKTSTHGQEGVEAFLASEQKKYAPQLEAYADVLQQSAQRPNMRLALYYPVLSRLIWWKAE